jgi:TPR repeat protein
MLSSTPQPSLPDDTLASALAVVTPDRDDQPWRIAADMGYACTSKIIFPSVGPPNEMTVVCQLQGAIAPLQTRLRWKMTRPTVSLSIVQTGDRVMPLASGAGVLPEDVLASINDSSMRLALQCDGGETAACVAFAETTPDEKKKFQAYERACLRGDDTSSCGKGAQTLLHLNMTQWDLEGSPAYARVLFLGCKSGVTSACIPAAGLLTKAMQGTLAQEALTEACTAKIVDGCVQAALRDEGPAGIAAAQAACDAGSAAGCGLLGDKYADGTGVGKDPARARELRGKACDADWGPSCTKLGLYDKGCAAGDTDSCDVLCKAGKSAACDGASASVKEERESNAARAKAEQELPGLFQKCAANRAVVERWRIAGVAAERASDQAGVQRATDEIDKVGPAWSDTLGKIRSAMTVLTDNQGPRFVQLLRRFDAECNCRPTASGRCGAAGDGPAPARASRCGGGQTWCGGTTAGTCCAGYQTCCQRRGGNFFCGAGTNPCGH